MSPLRRVHLHSSDGRSRWNFAGSTPDAFAQFDRTTGRAVIGPSQWSFDDPFALVDWIADHGQDGHRWVGYLSYELARFVERLPSRAVDDLNLPLLVFGRFKADDLNPAVESEPTTTHPGIRRTVSSDDYQESIRRVIDYIAAGDVFQVNLAQRIDVSTARSADAIWQTLINRYPSAFGALLELDSFSILSNSPELFFRIETCEDGRRRIVNRPIKGTRPRGPGMREELERSAKDIAELAMIVDLQRNDLGRVCEFGSVRVTRAREIETHPTVFHGVATVEGTLRHTVQLSEILRAVFPCGSITGCPKIRAMEIIDELEPYQRGPYCGAIGYIDSNGSSEFNVAIRTMTIRNGTAHVSVGGGIVADSSPAAEYDETLVKAAAMLDALGVDPKTFA